MEGVWGGIEELLVGLVELLAFVGWKVGRKFEGSDVRWMGTSLDACL